MKYVSVCDVYVHFCDLCMGGWCVCVHLCDVYVCVMSHMWMSDDKFVKSVLFFHIYVSLRDQIQRLAKLTWLENAGKPI